MRIPDILLILLGTLAIYNAYVTGKDFPVMLAVSFGLALVAWALRMSSQVLLKAPGFGFGDIKLMAICGLWIDLHQLPKFFIISGVAGVVTALIWRQKKFMLHFPFGPALCLALFVAKWIKL